MSKNNEAYDPEISNKIGDSDAGIEAFPAGTIYDKRPIKTSPRAKEMELNDALEKSGAVGGPARGADQSTNGDQFQIRHRDGRGDESQSLDEALIEEGVTK